MQLAGYIDHTLLRADAVKEDIIKLCDEAAEYGFASVCVNPSFAGLASAALKETDVKVCTVIGFPLGASVTDVKVYEASDAIRRGADEIDMVMSIGMFKSGEYDYVRDEIAAVKKAVGKNILKVIIETCLLTEDEIVKASLLVKEAGADFVKTSTGFSIGGAKAADIGLIRKTVGPDMGIKASGGIRTYDDALAMIDAGADRIGASASVGICCNEKE